MCTHLLDAAFGQHAPALMRPTKRNALDALRRSGTPLRTLHRSKRREVLGGATAHLCKLTAVRSAANPNLKGADQ